MYLKSHSEELCSRNQDRIMRILTDCDKPEKIPHFPLYKNGILFSKDEEIAQIQETYGIHHRNVNVSKADEKGATQRQKIRHKYFLQSEK